MHVCVCICVCVGEYVQIYCRSSICGGRIKLAPKCTPAKLICAFLWAKWLGDACIKGLRSTYSTSVLPLWMLIPHGDQQSIYSVCKTATESKLSVRISFNLRYICTTTKSTDREYYLEYNHVYSKLTSTIIIVYAGLYT